MQKQLLKNIISVLCLLLICAPMSIVCINYSGLYFLLYLTFWVMIPGGLFLFTFKKYGLECNSKSLHFIYSFLLGAISLFIEFFILHAIGFIELIKYINPVFSIFAIIIFFTNNKKTASTLPKLNQSINYLGEQLPLILVILFTTYTFAFTTNFYLPVAQTIDYKDYTWHIGNIAQLSSNTPFENIRVSDVEFRYHYFNTLFYAIEKIIFNISAWILFVQHQILIIPILISFAFYNLYNKITKNKWCVLLMSLFTLTGFAISNSFMYHWASNLNAVAISTIVICAMFAVIKPLLQENASLDKKTVSHAILFTLFLLYVSGTKGPYGAIAILAILCFIIMQLLRKKKPSHGILFVFSIASISFYLIYTTLLASGSDSFFGGNLLNGILASVTDAEIFSELKSIPGSRLFLFIPSLILNFTLTLIPLCFCAIDCILYAFRKKPLSPEFVFAAFMAVIGAAAYYTFSISGNGQIYFLFCAIPFVGYLAFSKAVELVQTLPRLRNASILLTLCVSGFCFYNNIIFEYTAFSFSAMKNYFSNQEVVVDTQTEQRFKAYEFLKTHIHDGRLTISNKQLCDLTQTEAFHFISAFSETACYFEGYDYAENLGYTGAQERLQTVQNFFSNNLTTTEKHTFATENNIGYIFIFTEHEYPTTHPETGEFFEEIFANDSVTIYEII